MPRLHDRFPALRGSLPHLPLAGAASPVRPLDVQTADRAAIWLKDDGAYGAGAWGGNKVRKLEWILPDVRRRGTRTILTFGALGTNHGLATALYAREHGIRTALALIDQPLDKHVERQLERLANSGAALHHTRNQALTALATPFLVARHTRGLRLPYILPPGGSSPIGALGYVEGALEIAEQVETGQLPEPSHVVCAVGSGGTAAGLQLGLELAGLRTRVVAVVVSDMLRLDAPAIQALARRTARLLRRGGAVDVARPRRERLMVVRDQLGPGYGHPTPASRGAITTAREQEGLALDPVYTAKAFAAVLAGGFGDGPVLYLHTYGPR